MASDIVEHASPVDFVATLERLERAIAKAGLTVFARIDHAAGAREAGMSMRPATVLVYGNPKGGTPVMVAAPQAALDLPLRVLVRQGEKDETIVSFHPIAAALRAVGVPDDLAARLEPTQRLLLNALAD